MAKKIRTNPNGNLTELEFVKLIHKKELDKWTRKHNLITDKCPPYSLIASDQQCCYCVSCINHCEGQVKVNKDHYKIGKVVYKKEELDE